MSATTKQYTQEFYCNLQTAYNIFNKELFHNELPQSVIILNRKAGEHGHFCPSVYTENSDPLKFIAEISLNPDSLKRPIKETLATLAHEMVHLYCDHMGYKARKGFHSKDWVDKMKEIGLQPINKDGEEVNNGSAKLTHKIVEGDIFDKVCDKLLKEITFDLVSLPVTKEKKEREKTKFKYYCPNCDDVEFTGKRELNVMCVECGGKFLMEE